MLPNREGWERRASGHTDIREPQVRVVIPAVAEILRQKCTRPDESSGLEDKLSGWFRNQTTLAASGSGSGCPAVFPLRDFLRAASG